MHMTTTVSISIDKAKKWAERNPGRVADVIMKAARGESLTDEEQRIAETWQSQHG